MRICRALEEQSLGDSSNQFWVCDMRPIKTVVIERNGLLREGLKKILAETRFQPLRMCCSFDELTFPTYSREHLFILGALDLLKASQQVAQLRDKTCGASNKMIGRKLGSRIDGKFLEPAPSGEPGRSAARSHRDVRNNRACRRCSSSGVGEAGTFCAAERVDCCEHAAA